MNTADDCALVNEWHKLSILLENGRLQQMNSEIQSSNKVCFEISFSKCTSRLDHPCSRAHAHFLCWFLNSV